MFPVHLEMGWPAINLICALLLSSMTKYILPNVLKIKTLPYLNFSNYQIFHHLKPV